MTFNSLIFLVCSAVAHAKVQFLGVAIAGGDFGCQIDGNCPTSSVQLPLSSLGGGDGLGQMQHFVQDDGLNMFRLPTSWQFLANNEVGSTLDSGNLGKYDQLVQTCLGTGAYCMIDVHNFARFNNAIIGQGGPTDDQFVSLWTQLATKYATNDKIVFEIMNEPHDLDINLWAQTCQKVVTAIRNAGATSQMILLPGTNFDSAATLVSSGSADLLMGITNPDGTTDNLLLDIHKYLDIDNSGTHSECTTDNTGNFSIVADYLRQQGREGLISETGASSATSCMKAFCSQNAFINANADVFVGLVAWGAGSFDSSYVLSLTPNKNGGGFVDNALMSQCVVNTWVNSNDTVPRASTSSSGAPSSPTQSSSATRTDTKIGSYTMTMTMTATGASLMATTLMTAGGTPTPSTAAGGAFSGGFGGATGVLNSTAAESTAQPTTSSPVAGSKATSVKVVSGLLLGGMFVALCL